MTSDEKLDQILELVSSIKAWQAAHAESAKTRDRDISELRIAVDGREGGLRSRVQAIEAVCRDRTCPGPVQRVVLKVCENVFSGALLALIGWLLFVYKQH